MKDKKIPILLGCAVAAAIGIAMAAVGFGSAGNNAPEKTLDNALQLYTQAATAVTEASDISYSVTQKTERIIGSEAFNELSKRQIHLTGTDSTDTQGRITESLQIGEHTVNITETYTNGTLYFDIENSRFTCPASKSSFLSRLVPAAPLTPELYSSITGTEADGERIVEFNQATGIEAWLENTGASFLSAGGKAYIRKDGTLSGVEYNATYTIDDTFVRQNITVSLTEPSEEPISQPDGYYTPIESTDAIRTLEVACGYLLDPVSITAVYDDRILCQAFGDLRKQHTTVNAVDYDGWNSLTDTVITVENTGNIGAVSTLKKKELYKDGVLTTTLNGEKSESRDHHQETIKTQCQDIFVGTILLPQYITGVTVTQEENATRYEFTANETLAALLAAEACATVYQNTEILREHAQDYATTTCTGYLTISNSTGLPLSSGFRFEGLYTIDGLPYLLEFSAGQTYELLNDSANKAIQNEAQT